MENIFKGIKIEYHILQSFPVSCLNRDDVGSPKTAIVGGIKRARVSSQCWKRQVRLALHEEGVQLGVRTKRLEELISKNFSTEEKLQYEDKLSIVCKTLSNDTLVFFTEDEARAMADFVRNMDDEDIKKPEKGKKGEEKEKDTPSDLTPSAKKELCNLIIKTRKANNGLDGLDTALFGRMIAKASSLNVEAAVSFAHAISTHKVNTEVDYFTAVDDLSEENNKGAGHIDNLEFNSGTFYRYISLNLGMLYDYIGNVEDTVKAVVAFTKALYIAVPQARQKTQTGYCPWDYAHVYVRKGQEMQLSFETPVKATGTGYVESSIEAMESSLKRNERLMGSLFGKMGSFVYGDTEEHGIDQLVDKLGNTIREIAKK